MKRTKKEGNTPITTDKRPDMSTEALINFAISASFDEALKRIQDGTASDGLLQTFLKMGSPQARLDERNTLADIRLKEAKADNYQSAAEREESQKRALEAFTKYQTGISQDYSGMVMIDEDI